MCAILHRCKKARLPTRSPLSCSNSLWQGFAAPPPPPFARGKDLLGQGGTKYIREKFSNPTSDRKRKRREREREGKGTRGGVRACLHVRLSSGEKMPAVHECPTSLPNGRQPPEPPAVLAMIRAEDKDIARWNTIVSKVRKLLIFFT